LDKIRILMGAETTHRTRKALLDAVRALAKETLDKSLEDEKEANPFLNGVPAISEALKSRQIDCRVYDKDKFHAKAYITHAKLEVVGAQALVGSSNFTRPGLTENIEINIQVQSGREVAQLQEWFDKHWAEAKEITDDVLALISRHTHAYTPFDVYTNDHFLSDTTKNENEAPSPSAVKCRTAAPGCPWAGEGACPPLSYKGPP
jgi:phosphatidylserine/phosphatidylglycerophosphate/cardiolipin synthase-like enzyme